MKRGDFLSHVGWTGTGLVWTLTAGGLLTSRAVAQSMDAGSQSLAFVQISDSHIGFHQAANPDVAGTLQAAITAINALPVQPAFVIHTGDITHLSKPEQFDQAKQILGTLKAPLFTLPGEHDFIGSTPKGYFDAFSGDRMQRSKTGWYSWDQSGAHFVALVNVFNFEKMGLLGSDQLAWLERDLSAQRKETPIVVFTHVPLYALYEQWGWTTEDGSKALAMLAKFDRVTVLNGHIHQIVRHSEGNIDFASADATAYPQPAPGMAPKPGPVTLPKEALLKAVGYRTVSMNGGNPNIGDHPLG
jgi:3',5'-cyclic-AMP phosphodiesterase